MELSILQRVRRNHAIEHAAMHLLGRTLQAPKLAARSDWRGITFYGDVDSSVLKSALEGGLLALNSGQPARLASAIALGAADTPLWGAVFPIDSAVCPGSNKGYAAHLAGLGERELPE